MARQELENKNIAFSLGSFNKQIYTLPIGSALLNLNNKFDTDINKNIKLSGITNSTNIIFYPGILFSFTNQYVEDDIWHYDFDIKTKIDWYFKNGYWDLDREKFDYNKFIWNNKDNLIFAISGKFDGFNSAWGGEQKIFTAHSATNLNIADNGSWPYDWFDNTYGTSYSNYVNESSNKSRLILNNPTNFNSNYFRDNNNNPITSGYPIQSWYEIYNKKGLWQPINNQNSFYVWNSQVYIGDFINSHYNFNGNNSRNIKIMPTSSRNYNLLVYLNYKAIPNGTYYYNKNNLSNWYLPPSYENIMGNNKILQVQQWPKDTATTINYPGELPMPAQRRIKAWQSAIWNSAWHSTYEPGDTVTPKNTDMFIAYGIVNNNYYVNYYIDSNDSDNFLSTYNLNCNEKIYTSNLNNNVYTKDKWPANKHISYYYAPQLDNFLISGTWTFNLDWPNDSVFEVVAVFENNFYTVNFFNQKEDLKPFNSQILNYTDYVKDPITNPTTSVNTLRFNGWKFENGEKLKADTVLCNTDYNLYAIWENIVLYNITYTFLNGKDNYNSYVTDKWNKESANLISGQDTTYLKQMNSWFDTVEYWRDIDTNLFYYPGQRVNRSLNLVYECDTYNNADWKNIIRVPMSLIDYSKLEPGWSYSATLMSNGFNDIWESRNSYFYINSKSNILEKNFSWELNMQNNKNGFVVDHLHYNKNIMELSYGGIYNNLTSKEIFSPYVFRIAAIDDNNREVLDYLSKNFYTSKPYCDFTFNNIWNFYTNTVDELYWNEYNKNDVGFAIFGSSVRSIYMLGEDWHKLSKRYDQILPIPFKAGYKFNGWWYNNSQFTDSNGKCIVAQFSSLYNIMFPNRVDMPYPTFSDLNFDSRGEMIWYNLNSVFYPEFINLKNDFKHHFPYVLVNKNAEENVNFFDYSRMYTTKWLNNYTTFNNSYYFPSQLVPYQE